MIQQAQDALGSNLWAIFTLDANDELVCHAIDTYGNIFGYPALDIPHAHMSLDGWDSLEEIRKEMIYYREQGEKFDENCLIEDCY